VARVRGGLHRWALHGFRRIPRPLRLRLVRTLTPSFTVGSLCMIEHDGRLLLLRQHHRHGWTLPGGLINRGETAEAAACREVLEETGLRVEVGAPVAVVVDPRSRWVDVLFHVPVDHEPRVQVASEAARAAWLTMEKAGQVDGPTAHAFAEFTRARRPGAQVGRLLSGAGTEGSGSAGTGSAGTGPAGPGAAEEPPGGGRPGGPPA
jgi:8-oxo-dGTP diphosphatase